MTIRRAELALVILLSASACTGSQHGILADMLATEEFEGRCALSSKASPGARTPQSSGDFKEVESASLPPSLSSHSREIAETIGVLNIIKVISALEGRQPEQDQTAHVDLLDARQQLSNQIQSALFEVQSTTAEVRCEKERADQLADRLEESLNREVRVLTVSAIISGAVFGFLSGGLVLAGAGTAGTALAISGGVVETVFGTVALSEHRSGPLQHTRNILHEIWDRPDEQRLLPDTVWRFLNQPLKEEPQHRSLRETLILRWRHDGRLGRAGSYRQRRRIALFFGPGGLYEIQDLRARAAMLNLLEADINLMTQDLNVLLEEVLVRDHHEP